MAFGVLIHIGYHKTGSTFLQWKFFTAARRFVRWPERQGEIHPHFIDIGPYEEVPASTKAELLRLENESTSKGVQLVVSHERFSGHPSSGGYDGKAIADRLKQIFPNGRVLIVIREQAAMIQSAYGQFISEGGSLSLQRFLNDPQEGARKIPWFSKRHFEYAPAIRYYRRLFGTEQVLVLPYEHFRSKPVDFLNRIGRFAQQDEWVEIDESNYPRGTVNPSRKVITQVFRRALNATVSRTQLSNSGFVNFPKVIRLYEKTTARIDWIIPSSIDRVLRERQQRIVKENLGDYFVRHNRDTADLIDWDLNSLGYCC